DVRVHHQGSKQAAHPADRGDLAGEPHPELGIGGQVRADHLYRDRSPARGHAQVHVSHAAAAEPADQPVRADPPRIPLFQTPDHAIRHLTSQSPLTSSGQNNPKTAPQEGTGSVGCYSDTSFRRSPPISPRSPAVTSASAVAKPASREMAQADVA